MKVEGVKCFGHRQGGALGLVRILSLGLKGALATGLGG